VYGRAV